jgi:sugar (pentulose or hexulose) kinase
MILAIDVGTTSLKLGVFNQDLRLLATTERGYSLETPDPKTVQIDPRLWWSAFLEAMEEIDFPPGRVEILTLSVNSPGFTPMDEDGEPLMPAFLHLDRRAYPQSKRILKAIGESTLLEVTGNIPNPGASTAANILWIRDHFPDVDRRTAVYGHTNTFFAKRLTGRFGVDPSNICMSNLFNTARGWGYEPSIARELDIDLGKLPTVYPSYERIGTLRREVASLTGLREGIPVLMGANDATCAALSAEIVHHGDIMNVTGTTEMVVVCMDHPEASPRYNLKNHAVDGRWNAMFALNTGGKAVEWAHRQFFRDVDEQTFYRDLIPRLLSENRKHLPRFHPYLTGDRYSLKFKTARFSGITLSTTREDLLLAVLYGVAHKVKEFLRLMEDKGIAGRTVNVTGGGAEALLQCKQRLMPGWRFRKVESGSLLGAAKLVFLEGGTG